MTQPRQLRINGQPTIAPARTVADLLEFLKIDPMRRGTAVALNEEIVARGRWGQAELQDGDSLEIIHPVQGG
jgi:thiamine biosynthesis protein ThiS